MDECQEHITVVIPQKGINDEGIILLPIAYSEASNKILIQDFGTCPDLYPAVALTCERLGIELHATGTESLPIKESDRLRAVREHRTITAQ